MTLRRTVLIAIFLHAAASAAFAQSTAFTDSLRRAMPELLTRHRVPGAGIAIVRNGDVAWSNGFGQADVKTGALVTDSTVFQVASISKSVAAWGLMKLVEQGKLDLDAPIGRYLKRWNLPPSKLPDSIPTPTDINARVNLRRMLSHTAGLSLSGYPGFHPDSGVPAIEENLSGKSNGPGAVFVSLLPGGQWRYSGGGYTLAQLVSEEVSGRTFADYMQENVLKPLGMKHSAYTWTEQLKPLTATAYNRAGNPIPNYVWIEHAAAGLYTTAPSLARFVAASMRGPRGEQAGRAVLKPATVESMHSPAPNAVITGPNVSLRYGLGHFIDALPSGAAAVQHGGSNRGWKAQWEAVPSRAAGIVVLTNSDNGAALHTEVVCLWYRLEIGEAPRKCTR